ncbi:MAG: hypothetical protein ACE5HT_05110 [Gemmatimonadales bacterium]
MADQTVRVGRLQRGAALALAVFALFVVGALVSITLLVGLTEHRIGRNLLRLRQSLAVAERGLVEPVRRWNTGVYNRLSIGDSIAFAGQTAGSGGFRGSLTRMNELLFLVVAEGIGGPSAAGQRLGALVRIEPLDLRARAALTTSAPTEIDRWSIIDGSDHSPFGWTCPPDSSRFPAVRIPAADSSSTAVTGCPTCVSGGLGVMLDSLLPPSLLRDLGVAGLAEFRNVATVVFNGGSFQVAPISSNATCVTAAPTNWGDPYDRSGPCGDYFPLVYSLGSLQLIGGRGQGILVVDGDLSLAPGVEYDGLAVSSGSVSANGARVLGAVVSLGSSGRANQVLGGSELRYSSCAMHAAVVGSGTGFFLRERGWLMGAEIP